MRTPVRLAALSATALVASSAIAGAGCHRTPPPGEPVRPACATAFEAALPGVEAAHRQVGTWLSALPAGAADAVLLDGTAIDRLNRANAGRAAGFQDVLADGVVGPGRVHRELEERLGWLGQRLADGRLAEVAPGTFDAARTRVRLARPADEIRIIHAEAILYCIPTVRGLFTAPSDPQFDRNRCSGLHPGEVIRVLRRGDASWLYVHAGHSVGWLKDAVTTPPVDSGTARSFRDAGERVVVVGDRVPVPRGPVLRLGTSLPLIRRDGPGLVVRVPTPKGLVLRTLPPDAPVRVGFLPLTRRNVLTLAFSLLDQAYGWGGYRGGRDCSRLILDVLAACGLRLGRHSGVQAVSGHHTVELGGMDDRQKTEAIRGAARRGLVLLYMSGHILVYLGESGRPFAISSLSEYLRPCGDGREQVVRVDRVAVSDLELGRGTSRRSFLERLERLAVFGP